MKNKSYEKFCRKCFHLNKYIYDGKLELVCNTNHLAENNYEIIGYEYRNGIKFNPRFEPVVCPYRLEMILLNEL